MFEFKEIPVPKLTFDFGNTDNKRKNRTAYYIGEDGTWKHITLFCSDAEYKTM